MLGFDIRRRRDTCPSVNVDSLMTFINDVDIAIVNTVRSNGTMFSSLRNYPENAMFTPLRSIEGIMESFMTHVERWAARAQLLKHCNPEIKRIYMYDGLPDHKKFPKIRRMIRRNGEIDEFYCGSFSPLIEELKIVAAALDKLAIFLHTICSEGNSPSSCNPNKRARTSSSVANVVDDEPPSPITRLRSISIDSPTDTSSSSPDSRAMTPKPSQHRPMSDYRSDSLISQTPRPAMALPWKVLLSDRYQMDSLFVSATELAVFRNVLSAARSAKETVEQAQRLCHDCEMLANDMYLVFSAWENECSAWKRGQEIDDQFEGQAEYAQ
ncbi:hypothetical protein MMC07_001579 [Pseudocyphellaria aurata]|nr:hypothetical protein [Pseudocyphellaria aurata]